jgi:hypothetical protein
MLAQYILLGRVLDTLGGGTAGQAGNLAVVEEGALLSGALRAVVTPGYRHAHLHGS